MWTIIKDDNAFRMALQLARGVYQRDLLYGKHNLSGSSLAGRAREYGARYAASRDALLTRMEKAKIPFYVLIGDHNKKILVIGGKTITNKKK